MDDQKYWVCLKSLSGSFLREKSTITSMGKRVRHSPFVAPERILGMNIQQSADVWSFACTLFEVCLGERLFVDPPDKVYRETSEKELNLAQLSHLMGIMERRLTPIPKEFTWIGNKSKDFFTKGSFRESIKRFNNQYNQHVKPMNVVVKDQGLLRLLRDCLNYFPNMRPSAEELLKYQWVSKSGSGEVGILKNSPRLNLDSKHQPNLVIFEDLVAYHADVDHPEDDIESALIKGNQKTKPSKTKISNPKATNSCQITNGPPPHITPESRLMFPIQVCPPQLKKEDNYGLTKEDMVLGLQSLLPSKTGNRRNILTLGSA